MHKKKWTEYLLEFAMLFLAVFLGFIAENIRERQVEKHQEKEYIHSFKEDLENDTMSLRKGIRQLVRLTTAADSLVNMINDGDTKSGEAVRALYRLNIIALNGYVIVMTDRTAVQLKNAGGMRLIRRKPVADGIVDYWQGQEELNRVQAYADDLRVKARDRSYTLFDNKFYDTHLVDRARGVIGAAQLMTPDHLALTEFANRVGHLKNLMNTSFTYYLKIQIVKADSLIRLIDRHYPE